MDFQPLQSSQLPRKDQALQEYIDVVPDEWIAIEADHLENCHFQLQPLHVREIIKFFVQRNVEDEEENLKPFATCFLKIASRMRNDTLLVHGFLMEPKLNTGTRKICQMELQITKGLKWPVQDVSRVADVELNMLRPSKIPVSLLLDAQPKMSPLLQPSQSTGAIPSSGSVHQQPNGTCQDGGLQYLEELGAKYKGGEPIMSSEAPKPDPPPPSGPLRLAPPGEGRRRNEPYRQPYSPRPNKKGASSSSGAAGEGTSSSGTLGGDAGPSGSGPPASPGEAGGPSNDPENGETKQCCCKCCII